MDDHAKIKYLKLPFLFDEEALKRDLAKITESSWLPQIYKMNYEGEWTSLALLSETGANDTFAFANGGDELLGTPVLNNCSYFKVVIDTFKSPLISARLLKLHAGAYIKPHTDYKLGYEDDNFRVHIPIVTNKGVKFLMAGERVEMLPGECWYTNVNFTHSVENRGAQDRVHLVLDMERSKWSDEIFFGLAPREHFNLKRSKYSRETLKRMIEELKRSDEPHTIELIKELEKGLDAH